MRQLGPRVSSLSGLTIGSLELSPAFASDVTEYTCATENATNKVTATATDIGDTIAILVGETPLENAHSATWAEGANTLTVTVTDRDDETNYTTYTVTVTYTPPEPDPETSTDAEPGDG